MSRVHPSPPDPQTAPQPDTVVPKADPFFPVPPGPAPGTRSERDSRGRFAPGNKGGPGNPHARRCAALRQAMLEVVTAADLQAIMRELIERARLGEVAAARLVLAYAIGKPDRAVDPDTVDLHELQPPAGLPARPPAQQCAQAKEILGTAIPTVEEAAAEELCEMIDLSVRAGQREPINRSAHTDSEPSAPAENKAQPAAAIATPAPTPRMQAQPASVPKRDRGEPLAGLPARPPARNAQERPAATNRRESPHGQPRPGSEVVEVVGLVQALSRQLEQEAGPGFRQELARRLMDHQRLERTAGQPSPIANRVLTAPSQP